MSLMQIESLKVFCDLADTQSFTKAAQINKVTPSAVSQAMTSLEKQFKCILIERNKHNFRLTQQGKIFFDYSRRIVEDCESILNKCQEIKGVISGNIHVSAICSIGLHLLPPHIKRFLQDHPTVNVQVHYRHSDKVYEDVLNNLVDIGLVAYPVHDSRIETVHFRKEPLTLICHPQHPFAQKKTIRIEALKGQTFVSFESDLPTRIALDRILKKHRVKVKRVVEFDNIEMVKKAVELDLGVAIVPRNTIHQALIDRTLCAVNLEGKYSRDLGVIYKKTKVLSPAMKKFISLLKESL